MSKKVNFINPYKNSSIISNYRLKILSKLFSDDYLFRTERKVVPFDGATLFLFRKTPRTNVRGVGLSIRFSARKRLSYYNPAFSFNASALSVFSHGTSKSVRPKCP